MSEVNLGLACVIMASGLSKRFGSNKLLADFGGQPMICRILNATEALSGCRVVVTRSREVEELCKKKKIETVYHELPYRSDTIRLGLEYLEKKNPDIRGCMFCPGDQPLLTAGTIQRLTAAAASDKEKIWRLTDGCTEGSPVIFPGWAFALLKDLPEGKGGNVIIKDHRDSLGLVRTDRPEELLDADRPEQLQYLLSLSEG
jgi:molybdenum cofactor cytidylyltransferase